jgi:hypothetical protein
MNERIQELANQADGVFIHKLMTGAKQYTFLEKDLEKFAELIVRECIDIAGKEDFDVMMKEGYPCSQTAKKIKQHFGVEETKREQFDKAMREAFKDGVDLSGKETP